jgi:glycosyltransferase involved in cell wall biosynthesis
MTPSLAIFTCDLGASFIDPHLRLLAPGRTVVVGSRSGLPVLAEMFPIECPLFDIDAFARRLPVRLGLRAGLSLDRMREIAVQRFLERNRISVVLGEYLDYFLPFVPFLDRLGLRYVVQGHGVDVSAALKQPGMAERILAYRSAKAVLTRSEFHRQRLVNLGLPAARVHVNPGGVEVPASPLQRDAAAAKRFLAISVMRPKKAPIYLLEAFRIAASRDPAITLDFVGGGPLAPAAQQFVSACDLENRVRLHGVVSEATKHRLLRECGVFVQHSMTDADTGDEEGLPAAIQEAMAHAMAVVGTRHAGIPEAVLDGETGLLVDEGDAAGMADAMLAVIPRAAAMGRAGHREALERHAWQHEKARLTHWLFEA